MMRAGIEVIVNAASGGGVRPEVGLHVAQAFRALGADARVSVAADGTDLANLARLTARGDAERIVAGGGDGTLNAVAAATVDSGKTLGVLPLGTLNHFARDLGIPLDLQGAVGAIVAGHAVRVDVGEVNGHLFLNNASLGLYPRMVREREQQQRLGWGKGPASVWAALAVLRRHPFLDIRLSVGGHALTGRTPFLFVGNNEYATERLTIGSRASLDKGRLSVYATSRLGRWGLVRLALRALAGKLRQERDLLAFATTNLFVETRRSRVRMALDGELIILRPPLHYAVRPGALRVLTPAAGQTPGREAVGTPTA